jgi:hypothetical protein
MAIDLHGIQIDSFLKFNDYERGMLLFMYCADRISGISCAKAYKGYTPSHAPPGLPHR